MLTEARARKPLRRCGWWEALLGGRRSRSAVFPPRLLGLLEDEPRAPAPGDQLVRVACEVDAETPQRFLSRGAGGPRSFWQLGDAWTAGVGAAVDLEPERREGSSRFAAARRDAREVEARVLEDPRSDPSKLRFFGGFSFHDRPAGDPVWRPFGAGRFLVPALELVHDAARTRLVGTARVPGSMGRDAALEKAREALDVAAGILERGAPKGPREYQIPEPSGTTDRTAWTDTVQEALNRIEKGGFSKVVLARTLDLSAPEPPDPTVILANLRQQNPGTSLFLFEPEPGHAFLGAAPELVANVRGTTFRASAVAGSVPRGDTEDEDDRLARQLSTSCKDRDEHAIVVRSMRERLARLTDHVEVARDTTILRLARIQHLERDLYARLGPDQHVLDLVGTLHPTPAVCGYPREAAHGFLKKSEPFERGWYAGPIGWFDAAGDGGFAPGLRSAVLHRDRWRLFAGAGIVEGSDPDAEWEETRIKFRPILDALGVQEAPP